MADLRIDESFDLPAPPDRVWELLIAPERIVGCLPGASLEEKVDEETYRGSMTVKLGAVTVVYRGEAVFEEVDGDARSIRMTGSARERTGSGSARMTMTGRVEPLEDGGTRAVVEADVTISGKMVRFGRGMIQRVTREIFRDFTRCLADRLDEEEEGPDDAGEGVGPGGDATRRAGSGEDGVGAESAPAAGAAAGEEEPTEDGPALRLGPVLWSAFRRWLGELVELVRGPKR